MFADDEDKNQSAQVGPIQPVAESKERYEARPEDHLGPDQEDPAQRIHRCVSSLR